MPRKIEFYEFDVHDPFDAEKIRRLQPATAEPLPKKINVKWRKTSFLKELLAGVTTGKFFAQYFNKKICHIRGQSTLCSKHFSFENFQELICRNAIPPSQLMIIGQASSILDQKEFKREGAIDPYLMVRGIYERKLSVIINNLERIHPSVGLLSRQFGEAFQSNITVNSYFTPPGAKTFSWHWDNHDTIILQIDGKKAWRIYKSVLHLPLETHHYRMWPSINEDTSKLKTLLTLEPGDILYIPRGTPHWAKTQGNRASLHLTVGLFGVTRHDLIRGMLGDALEECEAEIEYRQNVYLHEDPETIDLKDSVKRQLAMRVVDKMKAASLGRLHQSCSHKQSYLIPSEIKEIWDSLIGLEGHLRKACYRHTSLPFGVERVDEFAILFSPYKKLYLPRKFYPVLKFISGQKEGFQELTSSGWGIRKWELQELTDILVKRGLLAVASSP